MCSGVTVIDHACHGSIITISCGIGMIIDLPQYSSISQMKPGHWVCHDIYKVRDIEVIDGYINI